MESMRHSPRRHNLSGSLNRLPARAASQARVPLLHYYPLTPSDKSGHSSIQNGLSSIGSSLNLADWIKSVWLNREFA